MSQLQHYLRELTLIKCLHFSPTFLFMTLFFHASLSPSHHQIQLFTKMWKIVLLYDWRMLMYLIMPIWGNMLQPSPSRISKFSHENLTESFVSSFPEFQRYYSFIKIKALSLSIQLNQNLMQILLGSQLQQPPEPRNHLWFPHQSRALQESDKWSIWSNNARASQCL